MKNINLKKLFGLEKAAPLDTALTRERMQPHTIKKLESIGRELKERRPIFLGNGHIAILGPVACFIPLCALIVAKFGALMLLFMLIPAICTPVFLYLRKKGTDELYTRSDFDLGLFHYKSCKSYVGHGRYIYESVMKATVPYMAFALIMGLIFLGWGGDFERLDTRNSRTLSGQLEYVVETKDYIAIGVIGDERLSSESGEVIDKEYRLEKFVDELDESFFANVKIGDEITLKVNRNPATAKSSNEDKYVELYSIYGITSGGVEYFGEEHIARGERANTTAIVISASVYVAYCAICGVAIYLAKKYAERNMPEEKIEINELI